MLRLGNPMTRILIAGMGNVLRYDDGFGVEIARRLADQQTWGAADTGGHVKIIEVGIGGVHLVQELMDGYDALIIVDAVKRGSPPGTLHVLEAEVPDLETWPETERQDFLADMHYTTPSKALILAKALGVLPPKVFIIGCQPVDAGDLGIGLSDVVERATVETLRTIERIVRQLSAVAHEQEGNG
jgi:hydrogenase maturation protease